MALRQPAADDSWAAIRACRRLGIAIAAMIRMIATTIRSSISENPWLDRMQFSAKDKSISGGGMRITLQFLYHCRLHGRNFGNRYSWWEAVKSRGKQRSDVFDLPLPIWSESVCFTDSAD